MIITIMCTLYILILFISFKIVTSDMVIQLFAADGVRRVDFSVYSIVCGIPVPNVSVTRQSILFGIGVFNLWSVDHGGPWRAARVLQLSQEIFVALLER